MKYRIHIVCVVAFMALAATYVVLTMRSTRLAQGIHQLIERGLYAEAAALTGHHDASALARLLRSAYGDDQASPVLSEQTLSEFLLGTWRILEPPADFGYWIRVSPWGVEFGEMTHG